MDDESFLYVEIVTPVKVDDGSSFSKSNTRQTHPLLILLFVGTSLEIAIAPFSR
ncbi:hypothetical protein I8751_10020 [Nostocaceae cyanobacterium CENA357]|uniref:Uncharacterized protein n=1 Tax=Atlanticothrix silvestris CENA357 TaxID=1725252 RepID=A0A8J7HBK8_9CYAN|nr:hypothetical protein [Atlanticothrix silvestris]MBH8552702.1 hypothetical protein [Atlanticothrix silvestris CENA357]